MIKRLVIASLFICLSASLSISPTHSQDESSNRPALRAVAVTFDDLPATHGDYETMSDTTKRLLASITSNKVPAIGFVNEGKLFHPGEIDRRTELLRMWLDAGLELGNHTFSHVYIDQVPISKYQEEVIRGETVTRMLLNQRGRKLRYFRHTQLRTGPTPEYKALLDRFLAERGYRVAPVTIDNQDFMFADIYSRAKARGDRETMKRVGAAYVPYMEKVIAFFEKLSSDFLGYEVKQVLLLHANELNADYFDDLVRMMRNRGYAFITLDDALKDKAYTLADAQTTRGLSWIHRWMIAKGQPMRPEPGEPEFITVLFRAERQ
jgi:peptidoglycan/xylan/chitin deacetylase (PgdA/CDA1 family)